VVCNLGVLTSINVISFIYLFKFEEEKTTVYSFLCMRQYQRRYLFSKLLAKMGEMKRS
jgi:hypothetical protein